MGRPLTDEERDKVASEEAAFWCVGVAAALLLSGVVFGAIVKVAQWLQ